MPHDRNCFGFQISLNTKNVEFFSQRTNDFPALRDENLDISVWKFVNILILLPWIQIYGRKKTMIYTQIILCHSFVGANFKQTLS